MIRLLAIFFLLMRAQLSFADFDQAMSAYQKQDYPDAFAEFDRLAREGDHPSQFNLGVMYYRGQQVAEDAIQAYAWMALASQTGDPNWSRTRDKIYGGFSDDQKKKAAEARRTLYEKFSDANLKQQDAVIIFRTYGRGLVTSIAFMQIDSDYEFSAGIKFTKEGGEIHVLHVKPGRYYLRRVGVAYANLMMPPNPQPDDINNTMLVLADSVTYIGDWIITEYRDSKLRSGVRYETSIDYSKEAILEAGKSNPELQKLPLLISKAGAQLQPVSWN